MSADITERALDLTFEGGVADHLQDLAATGVSAEWLTDFLDDVAQREIVHWQVGEAIAETVLENSGGVIFPWNSKRDERNPRSSLPGADLVGISAEEDGCRLVFGEVKSSADLNSPPSVLHGKSGMVQQLERLITDAKLHFTLIKWLYARAVNEQIAADLDQALANFINSSGSCVRLIGVLVRDTTADEEDVSDRGRNLGEKVDAPGSVELHALYMPKPMDEWSEWVVA